MKRRSFAIILSSLVAAYAATAFLAESTGCVDGVTPDCSGDSGCGPDEVIPAGDGAAESGSPDGGDAGDASDGRVDGATDSGPRDGASDGGDASDAKPSDARAG